MALICPKCGKEYSPRSKKYYQNHIETCTGKKSGKEKKPTAKSAKSTNLSEELKSLKILFSTLEKRIKFIEDKLGINSYLLEESKNIRTDQIFDTDKFKEILDRVLQDNSNNQLRKNIALKILRDMFIKKFKMSESEFEDHILRLYRKQSIDLQPGGNPDDYHLHSPTGQLFYYLITKS